MRQLEKGATMSDQYKDRFSEASKEAQDKSGYVCVSCKTKYNKDEAKKKDLSCCGRSMKELVEEGFGP